MICKVCGFDNKEGAAFCGHCGASLKEGKKADDKKPDDKKAVEDDQEAKTVLINSAENEAPKPAEETLTDKALENEKDAKADDAKQNTDTEKDSKADGSEANTKADDSEADTTILTSELKTPGVVAPQGGKAAPVGTGALQSGPAPTAQGGPTPMGQGGFAPIAPGASAPMGAGQIADKKAAKPPKPPKAPKEPKEKKAGSGVKAYIIVSIVLIVGLTGAFVYSLITNKNKVEDLNSDLDAVNNELETKTNEYDAQIAELEASITDSELIISEQENQIALYEEDIANYQASNDAYAAYDSLIGFAGKATGQGYSDFFCSDSVIHLSEGQAAVKVYLATAADGATVEYITENKNIASCEWAEDWENDCIATLIITPGGESGNTIVTIRNTENEEELRIFVYTD